VGSIVTFVANWNVDSIAIFSILPKESEELVIIANWHREDIAVTLDAQQSYYLLGHRL
jgi:hypothetical protein